MSTLLVKKIQQPVEGLVAQDLKLGGIIPDASDAKLTITNSGAVLLASTPVSTDSSTNVATTAFVNNAVSNHNHSAANITSGTLSGDRGVTAGSTSTSFVEYNGVTNTAGQFDGGTNTPTGTIRLNYGGYLYATAFNTIGIGDTATAATHYYVETGSDGYIRPKTLANVKTELNVNTTSNLQINSLGVGTAGSTVAGEIRATNNVTAYYSDARLKNFEGTITGALDKIKVLNGYYYKGNAVAEKYGYDTTTRQIGVSAQEVQAILPEIVTDAPIGDGYLTVWYEKFAPLFIEAIKELQDEVEQLKAEVKRLGS